MSEAIRKALELDPYMAEAHASLGFFEMFFKWEWEQAEGAFKKSIELNPNYATAHHWYAQLLAVQGRYEEAKAEMGRALEINPISYNYLADLGQIYYFNREYSEAEHYCRKALEIYPDFVFARFYLHQTYLKTGNYELAVEELLAADKSAMSTQNDSAIRRKEIEDTIERARALFREGGIRIFIKKRTSDVQDAYNCYFFAQYYSFLGRTDKALNCLEKAYSGRAFLATFVKAEPAFDILRAEPRYTKILSEMKLAQ
jgi:tetratricopeptide (TPR) repeat protein